MHGIQRFSLQCLRKTLVTFWMNLNHIILNILRSIIILEHTYYSTDTTMKLFAEQFRVMISRREVSFSQLELHSGYNTLNERESNKIMHQVALQTTNSHFYCGRATKPHFLTINNPKWRLYSDTCKWKSMTVYLSRRNTSVFLSIFLPGILMDPFDTVQTHLSELLWQFSYVLIRVRNNQWIHSLYIPGLRTNPYCTHTTYPITPLFWSRANGTGTPLHCYQLYNFEVLIFFLTYENIPCIMHKCSQNFYTQF